jgi:tetratricopeptide (TPR) repeat protein
VRPLALFAAGLLALAFLVSAVLPAWSDHKTDDALAGLDDRSPQALEDAAADAELAGRLDPLAVRPLFAAAAVAEARGRGLEARAHLLDAVERQPWDVEAWERLTRVALALADREGVRRAAQRALELDPADPEVVRFVSRAQGILTSPEASATATGTPLPPAAGATIPPGAGAPAPGAVPQAPPGDLPPATEPASPAGRPAGGSQDAG